MSNRILKLHIACSNCGSSDGVTEYDDGQSHCFSCNHHIYPKKEEEYIPWRGVTKETMQFFGITTRMENGEPIEIRYPYGKSGRKVRGIKQKDFRLEGEHKEVPLFGMDRFSPGQSQSITITEGEHDAASVFQMMGSKYPVVSVKNGAQSARKDCSSAEARKFLNSFERIYLALDNDNPGQKAAKEVAQLFDVNKVYIVDMGRFKDANEFLTNGAEKEFISVWYNSKKYRPKGIVSDWNEIEDILKKQNSPSIASYPFPTLQEMTYGIRSKEVVLFTAQEKIGKTETFRAIEHHLLKTTDYNVGIIHLEEDEKRTIDGLITYEVKAPVHLPDCTFTVEEKLNAYKTLSKQSDRAHLYSHFGSEDPDVILDVVRSLVTQCGCKFIFLDHITMVVTGSEEDDERRKLDYISTRLAMMTKELDFTLFMISHVNDAGQTRGSRNISKVANLIIHLSREIEADDPEIRNTTNVMVKGNRFCAKSGPSAPLFFDIDTYTMSEKVDNYEKGLI